MHNNYLCLLDVKRVNFFHLLCEFLNTILDAYSLLCYNCRQLRHFVGDFNEAADVLMDRLRKRADGKTSITMFEEFNHVTMALISKVTNSIYKLSSPL